jgi:hypothetical protein
MKEMRNACEILSGKPGWKKLFGKFRRRWKDDFNMDERGCEDVD